MKEIFLILFMFVFLACSKDVETVVKKKEIKEYASYCLVYAFNPNLTGSHQTEIANLREGGFIMRYEVTEESVYHSLFEKKVKFFFLKKRMISMITDFWLIATPKMMHIWAL